MVDSTEYDLQTGIEGEMKFRRNALSPRHLRDLTVNLQFLLKFTDLFPCLNPLLIGATRGEKMILLVYFSF
jgi:hypothetical protein